MCPEQTNKQASNHYLEHILVLYSTLKPDILWLLLKGKSRTMCFVLVAIGL